MLIIIQNTFIWLIAISEYNIVPDLVLIGIVLMGIKRGKIEAMLSGFFAGLILDIMAGSFLGLLALIYTIMGFASGFFREQKDKEKVLPKKHFIILITVISIISSFIYFQIYFLTASSIHNISEIMYIYVLPTAAYTLLVSTIYILIPNRMQLRSSY
ncbi:MAG: rod shape-determining protein MreD [Ignavibacteria bacterium]|nr:rod shape-determining protein MreD [Ignavibacteria bacterium]